MAADVEGPSKGIRSVGYSPWVFRTEDGRQLLVQIFTEIGTAEIIDVVIATRTWDWDTWSPPLSGERR